MKFLTDLTQLTLKIDNYSNLFHFKDGFPCPLWVNEPLISKVLRALFGINLGFKIFSAPNVSKNNPVPGGILFFEGFLSVM